MQYTLGQGLLSFVWIQHLAQLGPTHSWGSQTYCNNNVPNYFLSHLPPCTSGSPECPLSPTVSMTLTGRVSNVISALKTGYQIPVTHLLPGPCKSSELSLFTGSCTRKKSIFGRVDGTHHLSDSLSCLHLVFSFRIILQDKLWLKMLIKCFPSFSTPQQDW